MSILSTKQSVSKQIRRYLILLVSLFIMAFGVSLSIKAELGTTPISSLPYVLSRVFSISVGTATILMHLAFIVLQIFILRKSYQPIQLLQLPVALVFGWITDFALWCVNGLTATNYWQQCLICAAGIFLVAVGVSCEVAAGAVTLAGEGLILAICKVSKIKFGTLKVIFDSTLVATASLLSFLYLHQLIGVREGTLAAAICVGLLTKRLGNGGFVGHACTAFILAGHSRRKSAWTDTTLDC